MSEIPAAPSPITSETDQLPEDYYTCNRRLLGSEDDKRYQLIACADLFAKKANAEKTPAELLMPWAINPPTLTTPAKKIKAASSSEEERHGLTDDEDSDGLPADEAKIYKQQVLQSDEFDVDHFSDRLAPGRIIPVELTQYMMENCATPAATRALTEYNSLKHKDFELMEIEKMNSDGYCFFLTFKAKSGGIFETFQAKVVRDIVGRGEDPYSVKLCRIKDVTA